MSVLLELVIGLYILVKLCCVIEDQVRTTFISLTATFGAFITVIFVCISVVKVIVNVIVKTVYPVI